MNTDVPDQGTPAPLTDAQVDELLHALTDRQQGPTEGGSVLVVYVAVNPGGAVRVISAENWGTDSMARIIAAGLLLNTARHIGSETSKEIAAQTGKPEAEVADQVLRVARSNPDDNTTWQSRPEGFTR